jgi:hypothetical protein
MKGKVVILILLNAIIFTLVGYWFHFTANMRIVNGATCGLQHIDKIAICNLKSNWKVFLQKSSKSGKWEMAWGDNIWPANGFAVERFYEKLENHPDAKIPDVIPPKYYYEVTIFAQGSVRKIQFTVEDLNSIFSDLTPELNKLQFSDDAILAKLFNPRVFSHAGNNCKIFKIKSKKWEFVFSKRQGKWFLDHSNMRFNMRLEIKDELILKFFHEIFSLESKDITFTYDNTPEHTLSISLYGEKASERVNFLDVDEQTCFVKNDAIDLFFVIEREQLVKIVDTIENLLRVHIFSLNNCNDISINTPNNGEYFNFHNPNNQNKWQFTHSQNGELKVKEISQEDIDTMLAVFTTTVSMIVAPSLLFEDKAFTVTLNEFSNDPQIFNFYRMGDQLFVGMSDRDIKFEIDSYFEAILFHNIRRYSRQSENIRL